MEFRVLQYFLAVTREGNISAAAQSLHLSQPSLSRQLKELEEELGVTLFIRGRRRIELTEEGLILRKRASEMMQLVELTESEISEVKNDISGTLSIGAGESRSMRRITAVFKELKDQYPNIRLNIVSGDTEDLQDRLDRGLLDFALIFTDFDKEAYHYLPSSSKEIFGVIMRKDSDLADKDFITIKDLYNKPLIVSRANGLHLFNSPQVRRLQIAATYNLLYNASLMVEDGIGYAISFDRLVDTSDTSPLCFRPLSPEISVTPTLIWKREQKLSIVSQLFIDRLSNRI
ncbi:LysR family transcriptional regulator [uncultured Ruminococcus sp.]|uniref:LysR family transcriptional regulator n=1 Tax=uncultured Ruminococcus sp. TaxID=165186 RepID=UPI002931BDAE|nr:LysR family transcriptional regulator [uncultured Ruminococcus sp.]